MEAKAQIELSDPFQDPSDSSVPSSPILRHHVPFSISENEEYDDLDPRSTHKSTSDSRSLTYSPLEDSPIGSAQHIPAYSKAVALSRKDKAQLPSLKSQLNKEFLCSAYGMLPKFLKWRVFIYLSEIFGENISPNLGCL